MSGSSWIGIGLTDKTHDFPFLDQINLRTRPVAVDTETGEVIQFDWVWPRANELSLSELARFHAGAQAYNRFYHWMTPVKEAKSVSTDLGSFFTDLRKAQKLIAMGRVPIHGPIGAGR